MSSGFGPVAVSSDERERVVVRETWGWKFGLPGLEVFDNGERVAEIPLDADPATEGIPCPCGCGLMQAPEADYTTYKQKIAEAITIGERYAARYGAALRSSGA